MTRSLDPIPFSSSSLASGAAVLWRHRSALHVTLINKLTFSFAGGRMTPLPPLPVSRSERIERGAGLIEPDELAPYLAHADVWATASRASPSRAARIARLSVRRGATILFDKVFEISADSAGAPLTAFAPLSKRWPVRAGLLGRTAPAGLEGTAIVVPDDIDWRYFQAAPSDQRIAHLSGGEIVRVENVVSSDPSLEIRVPVVHCEASLEESHRPPVPIRMVLDSVALDLDNQLCKLLFRGATPLHPPIDGARIERSIRIADISQADMAPRDSAPVSVAPRPDFAATTRLSDEEDVLAVVRSVLASQSAPQAAAITETAVRSDEEVAALRKLYATPFEEARQAGRTSAPLPRTIEPRAPPPPAELGQTGMVASEEVLALRARFATPFAAARGAAPTAAENEVLRAPPPASPPSSPPIAPRAAAVAPVPDLSSTALVASDEIAALRAKYATPFEKARSEAVSAPKIDVAPDAPPAPPPPPKRTSATPAPPADFGSTACFDNAEIAALRASFATPFDSPFRTPPANARAPLAPGYEAMIRKSTEDGAATATARKGSLGTCFLAAIADIGVPGMFDLGDEAKVRIDGARGA